MDLDTLNRNRFARLGRTRPEGGGGGQPNHGGQQQDQGGDQNTPGGLLDGLANDAGDSNDTGSGSDSGGQTQAPSLTLEQVTQAIQSTVPQLVESAIDRRINRQNNSGRRRRNPQQNDRNQNDDRSPDEETGVDEGALREARFAAREYLGDEVKFVDPVERAVANRLLAAHVADWDGGGNPDEFGRQTGRSVAADIKALRNKHEELLMKVLRKKGMLVESGQGAPQSAPGFGSAGPTFPTSQKDAAQQAVVGAQSMAAQWNARNGHQPAQQTASTS